MPKKPISATIETKTIEAVKQLAAKEKRSFSQMVDILLQKAIELTKQ